MSIYFAGRKHGPSVGHTDVAGCVGYVTDEVAIVSIYFQLRIGAEVDTAASGRASGAWHS